MSPKLCVVVCCCVRQCVMRQKTQEATAPVPVNELVDTQTCMRTLHTYIHSCSTQHTHTTPHNECIHAKCSEAVKNECSCAIPVDLEPFSVRVISGGFRFWVCFLLRCMCSCRVRGSRAKQVANYPAKVAMPRSKRLLPTTLNLP